MNPTKQNAAYGMDSNHQHHHHHKHWSSGLCGCFSDVPSCCLTFWCPCVTFGRIAEIADKGNTSCAVSGAIYTALMCFTCCSCLFSCLFRSKLRNQYMLEESPCNDCLVHCCCETCALCQEYRELKHQGFDMTIGWQEGQNIEAAMSPQAPAVQGGMRR